MTQEQWFARLKTWVPKWFLVDEVHNIAILQALAKLLAERMTEVEGLVTETFIQQASASWLALHGKDRNVFQAPGEDLEAFRLRVRNSNTASKITFANIEDLVESMVVTGSWWVKEDFRGSIFCARGDYFSRSAIIFTSVVNGFTIYVDNQGDMGVINAIAGGVNAIKAFGCLYRLVERTT